MFKNMLLTTLFCLVGISAFASVDELDQNASNQAIQGTVVLRVNQQTGEMAMVQVNEVVQTKEDAVALANQDFQAIPKDKIRSELDREVSASSWYWYFPGFSFGYNGGYGYGGGYGSGGYGYGGYNQYNPYYYSYGNCYNPWYSYSYNNYAYYYYNRYSYYW